MKLINQPGNIPKRAPFSILERIELGETALEQLKFPARDAFSILERIELGETGAPPCRSRRISRTFSILERIELGETTGRSG